MTEPTANPENFNLASRDNLAEANVELRRLFPAAYTQGKVDFEKLRQLLGDDVTADVPAERYGLSWTGKSDAIKAIQTLTTGTLLPARGESVNFDTTENLIIEGDNLETLKLLQGGYHGRVKMIYIDPPYNTGNEFIYPDNYKEGLADYLKFSGQVSGEGIKLTTNTETDGRYHSKWLTMMYPRLFLARNLLREDGVIFVSIDDHEVHNLRLVMNEIFGEENFLGCITWQKKYSPANDTDDLSASHDYIIVFARNRFGGFGESTKPILTREQRTGEMNQAYANPDNDPRGPWKAGDYTCNKSSEERPNLYYSILQPNTGEEIWPKKSRVWAYSKELHQKHIPDNRLWWGADGKNQTPAYKRFLSEVEGVVAQTVWLWNEVGHTDGAKKEVVKMFPDASNIFETPKPVSLLQKILSLSTQKSENDLILDFFAGSGTTAQAVLEQNQQDDGNRKFILVQLPEPTDRKDYPTIAEITKERVRRVIKKLSAAEMQKRREEKAQLKLGDAPSARELDLGFKVFRLGSSNFKVWDAAATPKDAAGLAEQLKLMAHNVVENRADDALLYELILKSNLPLTSKIQSDKIGNQSFYDVADGTLVICLERKLTQETLRGIIARKPRGVICLDIAFAGNDQLKTNIVLEMKSHGIEFHTA